MEVRHLRYFVAVAEEASFSRAAERLGMATSPLSRRIRDLERELGVALFVRDYHRVTPTAAARAILDEARGIVERVDGLASLLPATGGRVATIVVGTAPEVSPGLRSRLLAALRTERPDLVVRQRPASTAPLLHAVLKGDVDLAFVHGRVQDERLTSLAMESQPIRVVVAQGAGFDDRDAVDLAELAHLPYTYLKASSAPFVARTADALLARHGIEGRLPVQTTHADLVPTVSAGQAFTLCGAAFGATRNAFLHEPVLLLPFDADRERLETNAVWRADRPDLGSGLPALLRRCRA
ncbi:LysR family transcriptional regulator [Pseudonocardia nematodicida]|uniref:LysR family transcriptional regulator n=1 Tax=Pseudonocardia nematodicida TaxID=1206997 RepID=A0ABV1K627_9PSEU